MDQNIRDLNPAPAFWRTHGTRRRTGRVLLVREFQPSRHVLRGGQHVAALNILLHDGYTPLRPHSDLGYVLWYVRFLVRDAFIT